MTRRMTAILAVLSILVAAAPSLAQCVCRLDKLTASDGAFFDSFGRSVAISDGTMAVGAIWDDEAGSDAGSIYVFERKPVVWKQVQKLLASDPTNGDTYGHAVAAGSGVVLGAALQHVHAGQSNGAVYSAVSRRSKWSEFQEIVASNGEIGDGFGFSIAMSADVAVVGATGDDDNGTDAGAAYVLRLDTPSGLWIEEQKLVASDGASGDSFGVSVAVYGETIVVGAGGNESSCGGDPTSNGGAAYVFHFSRTTSSWAQHQKLVASDCQSSQAFGGVVAVGNGLAIVGAWGDSSNGIGTGAAYVFRHDPIAESWSQEQKLLALDGQQGDQFGRSVALVGDTALVGAVFDNDVGPDYGSAYVFRFDGTSWAQHDKVLPDLGAWTAFFGRSVAMDGDVGLVGAHGEDGQRGAVYVYGGLTGGDCNANGMADKCDIATGTSADINGDGVPDECTCPWDLDGSGMVGTADLLLLLAAWGSTPGGPPDFDGGGVGTSDLLLLLANWGPCP